MSRNVVIVESPAKAKTINKYLGNDFTVLASYGHIRDLPSKNGSVDPDNQFNMIWELDGRGKKQIDEIKRALKGATNLYLATDPDREGEAISWHVNEVLKDAKAINGMQVERIVFHEITKKAILEAMKHPRAVNNDLVEAYLARRALDYLVGFTLSPVLWRKLPGARSAGRVQSVALRIVVDREVEIEQFDSQEYWSIIAAFKAGKDVFEARLTHLNGKKLEKFSIQQDAAANDAVRLLKTLNYAVQSIEKKQVKRNPSAPFITSTLQQEASRKLGFGASRTMQVAQRLYEGVDIGGETQGLITYMRTDSVTMSSDAIQEAREFLGNSYGANYVPATPRAYKTKAKNAQEAHECIRPTRFSLRPEDVAGYLDDAQLRLYELIWKRALSSQMEQAIFDQVSVDLADPSGKNTFRATGSTQVFDGFLRLYQEGIDEPSDDDDSKNLPRLTEKQAVDVNAITPNQHFTQPPPRFSEATLVKKLEELGIGRPSTYATLIQVLQDRKYVRVEKRQFFPEDRGRIVISFLMHYFARYVEYDFTAELEEELDDISSGTKQWTNVLTHFWSNFKQTVSNTDTLTIKDVIDTLENDLAHFLFNGTDPANRTCPVCKEGTMNLKLSKFGAFLGCSNYPECKHTRPLVQDDDAALEPIDEGREMGMDPNYDIAIILKKGPYGHYFEWQGVIPEPEKPVDPDAKPKRKSKKEPKPPKPKRVSLPMGVTPQDATLEMALQLATLPKLIGVHPETNNPMSVGYGRFGPYVKYEDMFVSIPKSIEFMQVTVDQAVDLIAKKKARPPREKAGRFATKKTSTTEQDDAPEVKKAIVKKAPVKKTAVKKTATKATTKAATAKKATVKKTSAE